MKDIFDLFNGGNFRRLRRATTTYLPLMGVGRTQGVGPHPAPLVLRLHFVNILLPRRKDAKTGHVRGAIDFGVLGRP